MTVDLVSSSTKFCNATMMMMMMMMMIERKEMYLIGAAIPLTSYS
jgi:hypothetical protein